MLDTAADERRLKLHLAQRWPVCITEGSLHGAAAAAWIDIGEGSELLQACGRGNDSPRANDGRSRCFLPPDLAD